jgi:C-terminal processing protease CtpA/Prc
MITGPAGSDVTLGMQRGENKKRTYITLTREQITPPDSVTDEEEQAEMMVGSTSCVF